MRTEALSGWRMEGWRLAIRALSAPSAAVVEAAIVRLGYNRSNPSHRSWPSGGSTTSRATGRKPAQSHQPPAQAPLLRPIRAYQVPEQQNPSLGTKLLFPRPFPEISAFPIPPAQFSPPPRATPLLRSPIYHNFHLSPLQLLCRNYKARLHGNPHNGISIRCCIEFLLKTSICLDSFHKRLELLYKRLELLF